MKSSIIFIAAAALMTAGCSAGTAPEAFGPVPTPAQLCWQRSEMNMFVHFGPNTYSGLEWGSGRESNNLFCPDSLDCPQWARVAKETGFGGVILTAKHHDGFSLWNNPSSSHSVAHSSWRSGAGDVLAELSAACSEAGVGFGVYLSPWDRNHPFYGSDRYNEAYAEALESVLTGYGPLFEVWFDGACGEGPNGKKQVYDWDLFLGKVREHQPEAIVFSNVGPGCRWVGNEEGHAGTTNWNTFTPEAHDANRSSVPGDYETYLGSGDEGGHYWIPAEVDVSIRPGWFWRASENDKVKTPSELIKIYEESVGRGGVLLLNVPPTASGRIHPNDIASLKGFRAALDSIYAVNLAAGAKVEVAQSRGRNFSGAKVTDGDPDTYWAPSDDSSGPWTLTVSLDGEKTFSRIVLQEYIPLGQRIAEFTIEALMPCETGSATGGQSAASVARSWVPVATGTTVGNKRILNLSTGIGSLDTPGSPAGAEGSCSPIRATALRLTITRALAIPLLSEVAVY